MQYQGGKSRIARKIAGVLNEVSGREIENCISDSPDYIGGGGRCFVSLFCGTCSIESKIKGYDQIILNDNHEYLIALLQAVQCGYEPPDIVTEDDYKNARDNKNANRALSGFIGIACSFGGKWFAGYARNNAGRNYAAEGKRSLLKDMATLSNARFVCGDYRRLPIPPQSVIYADPPYRNTTGYRNEKFDTDEFWMCMRFLAHTGHQVFVSEQEAPPDFTCIWQQSFTRTLDVNKSNQFKVTEKLFTYRR